MSAGVHSSPEALDAAGVSLIVVGSSFGGIAALKELLGRLPAVFPSPIVIVQHRADRPDVLTELLQWRTALKVVDATAGLRPKAGSVYIAEAGQQLTLDPDGCFVYGEPHGRCLVDPLLTTAAKVHAERLVAVILTGRLDDGAEGVIAVKAAGGRVFAQDRGSAAAFSMPSAATATGCVDFVLPPSAIASALITLAMLPAAAALFSVQPPPWALSA